MCASIQGYMSPKWLPESLDPEEGLTLDRNRVDMKMKINQDRDLKIGMEDFAFDEDEVVVPPTREAEEVGWK